MNLALLQAGLLVAVLSLTPAGARAAANPAPTPAAPPAEPPPPPKSVFTIDPQSGKDPFFPLSKRWSTNAVVKTNEFIPPPVPLFPDDIRCQGFSGTTDRPLVIINNKTVEKGERFELLLKGQRIRVQCVEIKLKNRSVVLEVNGITRELGLRTVLQ